MAVAPFSSGAANTIIANRTGFNLGVAILGEAGMKIATGIGETLVVAGAAEGAFSWVTGQMANSACSYTPSNP